jgi:hypothetical protein
VLSIWSGLLASFRISADARESYENSLIEHHAVAAAIRKRDPEEAEQAVHTLLAGTSRGLAPTFAASLRPAGTEPTSGAIRARTRREVVRQQARLRPIKKHARAGT